ncbi:MAG TPA: extracellular solute-binding protein [Candidatus Dormibacteraeota bacterium]
MILARLAATAVALVVVAACGSGTPSPSNSSSSNQKIGGSVSVWAEWTSQEQSNFLAALSPFTVNTGVNVDYAGKGSNMDTVLTAAVTGGAPPDVALVPDPGTLKTLATQGAAQDLTSILGSLSSNYGSAWNDLATVNGKLYGVWFKGANKNTIWYNPAEFKAAGISSPPTSWEQLMSDAGQLQSAGITPFSLCTDIGWPLADFWQNVYLKVAGADSYNKLATHAIKWTDPTVTTAFNTLGELFGKPQYLAGGLQGSLSNSYPTCVDKVFPKSGSPAAAMVFEGDFLTSEITSNSASYAAGTTGTGGAACTTDPTKTPCYDFFDFPAPSANASNNTAVQGAGDVALMLHDTPQARALMKYLAGSQGAGSWAKAGGFASPNKTVPTSAYPNDVAKRDAQALVNASSFVFSLDDLQGSWEKQMWTDLINFLKNPSSISSIEATMDAQATAGLGH